jgi:hypothetical protein
MFTHSTRVRFSSTILGTLLLLNLQHAASLAQDNDKPPKGFTALFNGKDFDDWTGARTEDPRKIAALSSDERAAHEKKMKDEIRQHWKVDQGELVSDGKEPYLATTRDYGDFEMWVDWKIGPKGDSGIYLRGVPQVQIWDPNDKNVIRLGADKGSGGLWNNKKNKKDPLVKADNPVGKWNRMYIRMIGPYVTVILNDKKTVDNTIMENYYDPKIPVFARGPIYLQTHGSETRFRNVFVREIPPKEANEELSKIGASDAEFQPLFNGKDLSGWTGSTKTYEVVGGELISKAHRHGNMFTKDTYDNFVARLEFKLPPGGNNGIALRSPITDKEVAYEGMETQILDDGHPKYKDLHEYQVHGSLYGLAPAIRGYLRPIGEWNYEEVTLDGDNLTVNVNGFEVLNTNIAEARKSPMDGKPHPGASRTDGHFGLLGHQDPVAFRNIRIKRLSK